MGDSDYAPPSTTGSRSHTTTEGQSQKSKKSTVLLFLNLKLWLFFFFPVDSNIVSFSWSQALAAGRGTASKGFLHTGLIQHSRCFSQIPESGTRSFFSSHSEKQGELTASSFQSREAREPAECVWRRSYMCEMLFLYIRNHFNAVLFWPLIKQQFWGYRPSNILD